VQHERPFRTCALAPRARLPARLEAQAVDAEREQLLALGHRELARELSRGGRPDAGAEALRQAGALQSSALTALKLQCTYSVTLCSRSLHCTTPHSDLLDELTIKCFHKSGTQGCLRHDRVHCNVVRPKIDRQHWAPDASAGRAARQSRAPRVSGARCAQRSAPSCATAQAGTSALTRHFSAFTPFFNERRSAKRPSNRRVQPRLASGLAWPLMWSHG